ncbi:hypothetical protein HYC85_012408 [Camellia sinensis]|uniref:Glutaredoxin domain-containing protein n=1 Tax=Camellia sinensis TaxID=4442 RepID=A0A7J7HCS3_CAMSI|nr:hypothetical protein HYC85_012408 [Camellia sinensis]
MRYSTTVPNYPDTHEDFMPTNKLQNYDLSLKDIVEQDVNDNPVMIYMKGVPDLPRCGFSSLAVRVLKEYNVPLSARNILEDPELKNAVKSFRFHTSRIKQASVTFLHNFGNPSVENVDLHAFLTPWWKILIKT